MPTQQIIKHLVLHASENLHEDDKVNNSLLSEPNLSKDWICADEDNAWKDL